MMSKQQKLRRVCRGFTQGMSLVSMSRADGHVNHYYTMFINDNEPFLTIPPRGLSVKDRSAELARRAEIFLSTGFKVDSWDVKGPPEGKTCTRVKSWDGPKAVLCGAETKHLLCCSCHAALNYPTMRYADAVALVHKMRGVR
jgi:hypothetical protein